MSGGNGKFMNNELADEPFYYTSAKDSSGPKDGLELLKNVSVVLDLTHPTIINQ